MKLAILAIVFGLLCNQQALAVVAFGSAGAVAVGSTSLSVAYPASISAGDLLVLIVGNKYPTNGPGTPTDWTLPTNGQGTGGAGAAGADSGDTYCTAFYKEADGSETGSLTVTLTSANSAMGIMLRYTKTGDNWSVAAAQGGDTSDNTSWSFTGNVDPGITAGDMVIVGSALHQNAFDNLTSQSLSATGVTFGTMAQRSGSGTNVGDDMYLDVADFEVSSGTSSAAPVFTATSVQNAAGGGALLRIRQESAGGSSNGAASYYYRMMQGAYLFRKRTPLRVMTSEQLFAPLTGGLRYGY